MSETKQRQYRALNGSEITEYILSEFRKAMVNSGQLPLHRVFHELQFVGGVKIRGWGSKPVEIRFSGSNGDGHPDDAVEVGELITVKVEPEPPSLVRERMTKQEALNAVANGHASMGFSGFTPMPPVASAPAPEIIAEGEGRIEQPRGDEVTTADRPTCSLGCGFIAKSLAGKLAHERHCKGHVDVVK